MQVLSSTPGSFNILRLISADFVHRPCLKKRQAKSNLRLCAVTKTCITARTYALRECKPYRCTGKNKGNESTITNHRMVGNRLISLSRAPRSIDSYFLQRWARTVGFCLQQFLSQFIFLPIFHSTPLLDRASSIPPVDISHFVRYFTRCCSLISNPQEREFLLAIRGHPFKPWHWWRMNNIICKLKFGFIGGNYI